ncbi:MAG: PD-(D/E)XK nuclease domain-containing protein, partial [Succinivibrio sp.]|nr:PD-(D/E)XK nuclease domain-containing protein [Succinivibrio sp.]
KYLESHKINLEKFQNTEIEVDFNDFVNPTTLPTMDENVLMCQTGYLTLKSVISSNRATVLLGFANREVSSALSRLLSYRFFTRQVEIYTYDNVNLLENCSAEKLIDLLNSVLAAVVYDNYPIDSEAVLRALLQFYFMGKGVEVIAEQHNSKGRSDLLINLKNRRIVLELKFSADGKNSEALLKDAVNQIEDKEYGIENLGSRELLKIACVFNGETKVRKIISFKTV